jgi:hypothetical protein
MIVLVALALALWPRESAAANAPLAVRTPEPYLPPVAEDSAVRRPLPVVAPAAAPRQPLVPSGACAPVACAQAHGHGASQVINLVMPTLTAQPVGEEMVIQLNAGSGAQRVELRLRRDGRPGPTQPVAPTMPSSAPATKAPTLAPEPAPTPPPAANGPLSRRLAVTTGLVLLSESYPAGGIEVAAPVPRAGLDGFMALSPDWATSAQLAFQRYTLVDAQHTPSRHQRQEFLGQLGAWRALTADAPTSWVGLGYWARNLAVSHTLPPPLTTPLVTSPSQLYHGPQLLGRIETAFIPGLTASLEAAARPYLFAAGDEAVAALAPMWGLQASAGVTYLLTNGLAVGVTVGYDRQASFGAGYVHQALGPALRLEGRF